MNIPVFWVQSREEVQQPDGRVLSLFAWGWSNKNEEEAHQKSRERLANLVARVRRGEELPHGYAYGSRPLREEILREVRNNSNDLIGLITRNSYGSLILNTPGVLFIDIDVPAAAPKSDGLLGKLFGKKQEDDPSLKKIDSVKQQLTSTGGSYRVYRTAAGLRVLCTDRLYKPDSSDAESLMRSLHADPSFIQLCKVQDSFRARLTPKPWRCGELLPPGSFPRDEDTQQTFEEWLVSYQANCKSFATCRMIEQVGDGGVHPDAKEIYKLHDDQTRALEELPLA